MSWRLEGIDTFETMIGYAADADAADAWYPLGEYDTQELAEEAAAARIVELEKTQPTKSSGGQNFLGIQDRVFIVSPEGTRMRWGAQPCPNCDSQRTIETREPDTVLYGYPNPVELPVIVPVVTCRACGEAFTDWRAEDARMLAVREHMMKSGKAQNLIDHVMENQMLPQILVPEGATPTLVSTAPDAEGIEVQCVDCGRKARVVGEPPPGKVALCPACILARQS